MKTHVLDIPPAGLVVGELHRLQGPKRKSRHVRVGQVLTDVGTATIRTTEKNGDLLVAVQGATARVAVYQYIDIKDGGGE